MIDVREIFKSRPAFFTIAAYVVAIFLAFIAGEILISSLEQGFMARKILIILFLGTIILLTHLKSIYAVILLFVGWSLFPVEWFPGLTINCLGIWVNAFFAGLAVAFLIRFLKDVLKHARVFYWSNIYWFIGLWFMVSLLSSFNSANPENTIRASLYYLIVSLMILHILSVSLTNYKEIVLLVHAITFIGAIIGMIAIYESFFLERAFLTLVPGNQLPKHLFPWGDPISISHPVNAAISTAGNTLSLGALLLLYLPFGLLSLRFAKNFMVSILCIVASVLTILGIVVSFSRIAIMILILLIGVYFWRIGRKKHFLFAILALIFIAFAFFPDYIVIHLSERFSEDPYTSMSFLHRLHSYKTVSNMLEVHPLLGFGLNSTFDQAFIMQYQALGTIDFITPDNWFLSVAAQTGILGLVSFILVIISIYALLIKSYRKTSNIFERQLLFVVLISISTFMIENFSFEGFAWLNLQFSFWLIVGIGFALANGRHRGTSSSVIEERPPRS